MAAIVEQSFEATRLAQDADGDPTREELVYIVRNADDEASALKAVLETAPEKRQNEKLVLSDMEIDERIAEDAWRVNVTYEPSNKDKDDGGDDPYEYTFETGGGTKHVAVADEHIGDFAPEGGVALDFDGAIGVDSDGNVGGVDIVMPQPGFTETVNIKKKRFTPRYKRTLIEMTGTVNNAAFRGFKAGEVLFTGASAQRSNGMWRVTFRFSVSKNTDKDFAVGDIVIGVKEGWDYLWFSYVDVEQKDDDGDVVAVVRRPVSAHVERVYRRENFEKLKIPKE